MTEAKIRCLISILAMIGTATPAFAQQPPNAAKDSKTTAVAASPTEAQTPAAPPPSADKTPPDPSPEVLKKARERGIRPELVKGTLMFCWYNANIGTRFKTKKCVDESLLAQMLENGQLLRDNQQRSGGCGGSLACGAGR